MRLPVALFSFFFGLLVLVAGGPEAKGQGEARRSGEWRFGEEKGRQPFDTLNEPHFWSGSRRGKRSLCFVSSSQWRSFANSAALVCFSFFLLTFFFFFFFQSLGKRQTAAPRNTPHRKPRAAPLLANPLLLLQGPSYGPKIYALAEKCCADTDPAAPASTPAVTPLSVAETAARPPARRRVGGRHLRRLALLAFARRPGVAHSAAACTLDQFLAALEAEIDCAATAPLPPPPPSSAA